MSRRKKRNEESDQTDGSAGRRALDSHPQLDPNPPRPSKPLLLATGALLLLWIGFLVTLAVKN